MDFRDNNQNKQVGKNRTVFSSFQYAIQGLKTAYIEERNMRIHGIATIIAVLCGFFFHLSANEWMWVLLVIFLVTIFEIINTCLENMVDLIVDKQYHPIAKKIKDMAAAGVLLSACLAACIGLIIFLPKVLVLLK